jgi:hypothetical protein
VCWDVAVPKIILDQPRIRALVVESEAASMAQHVRMGALFNQVWHNTTMAPEPRFEPDVTPRQLATELTRPAPSFWEILGTGFLLGTLLGQMAFAILGPTADLWGTLSQQTQIDPDLKYGDDWRAGTVLALYALTCFFVCALAVRYGAWLTGKRSADSPEGTHTTMALDVGEMAGFCVGLLVIPLTWRFALPDWARIATVGLLVFLIVIWLTLKHRVMSYNILKSDGAPYSALPQTTRKVIVTVHHERFSNVLIFQRLEPSTARYVLRRPSPSSRLSLNLRGGRVIIVDLAPLVQGFKQTITTKHFKSPCELEFLPGADSGTAREDLTFAAAVTERFESLFWSDSWTKSFSTVIENALEAIAVSESYSSRRAQLRKELPVARNSPAQYLKEKKYVSPFQRPDKLSAYMELHDLDLKRKAASEALSAIRSVSDEQLNNDKVRESFRAAFLERFTAYLLGEKVSEDHKGEALALIQNSRLDVHLDAVTYLHETATPFWATEAADFAKMAEESEKQYREQYKFDKEGSDKWLSELIQHPPINLMRGLTTQERNELLLGLTRAQGMDLAARMHFLDELSGRYNIAISSYSPPQLN